MKKKILVLSLLFTLLSCFSSFGAFVHPPDRNLPESITSKYYIMFYSPDYKSWMCHVYDEKPDTAFEGQTVSSRFLAKGSRRLKFVSYGYVSSSVGWGEHQGGALLSLAAYPREEVFDSALRYSNFSIDLGGYLGFFPYAPLPSEMVEIMRGVEIPIMMEIIGLIPLLIPFLVGLLAFWKGWIWLKMQSSGA